MSELPSCTSEKTRIARKNHTCCECSSAIDTGDKYHYLSGLWNGEPASYKTCMCCMELRDKANSFARDSGYWDEEYPALGGLHDWVSESGMQE